MDGLQLDIPLNGWFGVPPWIGSLHMDSWEFKQVDLGIDMP